MWTIFKVMGENLDPDELADLFGEALFEHSEAPPSVDLLMAKLDVDAIRGALSMPTRPAQGPLKGGRKFRSAREDTEVLAYLEKQEVSSFIPEYALAAMEVNETHEPVPAESRNGYEMWKLLNKKIENSLLIQKWAAMDVDMLDRSRDPNDASISYAQKKCTVCGNAVSFCAVCRDSTVKDCALCALSYAAGSRYHLCPSENGLSFSLCVAFEI